MTDLPHDLLDPTQQLALDEHEHVDQRARAQCGLLFAPRAHSGGSQQRFCSAECRLAFHAKGQRGQRVPACSAPEKSPAISRPTSESEASEADDGFVLMEQQDFIEIAWDEHGDLLLRQNRLYEGDHELRVCRDYFPQFLQALDVLRELILDVIRKEQAP